MKVSGRIVWVLMCACAFLAITLVGAQAGRAQEAAAPPTQALNLFDLAAPTFTTFTARDGCRNR